MAKPVLHFGLSTGFKFSIVIVSEYCEEKQIPENIACDETPFICHTAGF
jgi:hypothetical protein